MINSFQVITDCHMQHPQPLTGGGCSGGVVNAVPHRVKVVACEGLSQVRKQFCDIATAFLTDFLESFAFHTVGDPGDVERGQFTEVALYL